MACGKGTFAYTFDAVNPSAVSWAETRAAQLVTNVTAETRAAIRAAVVEGFEKGIAPGDTARLIRSSIGLTERDARAVVRRYAKLRTQGATQAKALQTSEKYAAKLLRSRSITIARTETMMAANEGQNQLWQQAVDAGYLKATQKKVWITADPCPICAPLDGETTPLNGSYSNGLSHPPAHPRCKCSEGLVN